MQNKDKGSILKVYYHEANRCKYFEANKNKKEEQPILLTKGNNDDR